jgi:hypothetical protein
MRPSRSHAAAPTTVKSAGRRAIAIGAEPPVTAIFQS